MTTHRLGIFFLIVMFYPVFTGCSTEGVFEEPSERPAPVILRTPDGQEQEGRLGTYSWKRAGVTMAGTLFAEEPVTVDAGDTIQLDFTALGTPIEVSYVIYAYDEVVQDKNQMTFIMPERSRHGSPTLEGNPSEADLIEVSLDIEPGHYVLKTQSLHADGDTEQGFHLIIT